MPHIGRQPVISGLQAVSDGVWRIFFRSECVRGKMFHAQITGAFQIVFPLFQRFPGHGIHKVDPDIFQSGSPEPFHGGEDIFCADGMTSQNPSFFFAETLHAHADAVHPFSEDVRPFICNGLRVSLAGDLGVGHEFDFRAYRLKHLFQKIRIGQGGRAAAEVKSLYALQTVCIFLQIPPQLFQPAFLHGAGTVFDGVEGTVIALFRAEWDMDIEIFHQI